MDWVEQLFDGPFGESLKLTEVDRERTQREAEFIARELNLSPSQVIAISDDLEKHMTFLFRNERGAVTWAYPVTVDETPHQVTFSTGEQIHAA